MTKIEEAIGRRLEREKRGGIPHFVPGQHAARLIDPSEDELAELSFVDVMGHAWLVVCAKFKADGDWTPIGAFKGGQVSFAEAEPPALSEKMIAALNAPRGVSISNIKREVLGSDAPTEGGK